MSEERTHVLILDDSRAVLLKARVALERAGFCVRTFVDPSLLERAEAQRANLVLVDVHMTEMYGDDVVSLLREVWQVSAPVWLYSDLPESELRARARAAGAHGAVAKSKGTEFLVSELQQALGEARP